MKCRLENSEFKMTAYDPKRTFVNNFKGTNMKYLICTIVLFSIVSICSAAPPKPANTKYLKTEVGGFAIEKGKALYSLKYKIKKPFDKIISAVIEYENPDPNGEILIDKFEINPGQTSISTESKVLKCMKNNNNYKVVLKLLDGDKQITKHKDMVQFALPDQIIRQYKITLC